MAQNIQRIRLTQDMLKGSVIVIELIDGQGKVRRCYRLVPSRRKTFGASMIAASGDPGEAT